MINTDLLAFLEKENCTHITEISGRGICALQRFAFTTGLSYGLDYEGRAGRYCYSNRIDAMEAIKTWNGVGDPPDNKWVKHKGDGGEYNNPFKLKELTLPYDKLTHLECDGLTRVLSYILYKNGIIHRVYSGIVTYKDKGIPHFWIVDEYGWVVDYRLRMWYGEIEEIPHGVFRNSLMVKYTQQTEYFPTTDEFLFKTLVGNERI